MRHIAPILEAVLGKARLRQGMANHEVMTAWERVVGEHLARSTRPVRIQGDALWVYVDSAVLLHHLTYLAPRLVRRVREEAPETSVQRIRFTLNPEG